MPALEVGKKFGSSINFKKYLFIEILLVVNLFLILGLAMKETAALHPCVLLKG